MGWISATQDEWCDAVLVDALVQRRAREHGNTESVEGAEVP